MRKKNLLSMVSMSSAALALAVCLSASATPSHFDPSPNQKQQQGQGDGTQRHVDLVIALDTSSSMDGLIDAARAKLWDAVNLLAQAHPRPILRVGVISYGNSGYDAGRGWVRKDIDLTGDLDSVYAKLFALSTNGGEEYVARAIQVAADEMQWSSDPQSLRILFVAGNEPANQDPKVSLASALGDAHQHRILVNAIYCGDAGSGEAIGWQGVAHDGRGEFASIDQNHIARVNTPVDDELNRLSSQLNSTYVAYGARGKMKAANQAAQDGNAMSLGGGAGAARATSKASAMYRSADWDLVDAVADKKADVAKMPASELPAPVAALAPAKREEFVQEKAKERKAISARITELSKQRDAYLKSQKNQPKDGVDRALSGNLRKEAESAGFAF